MVPVWAGSVRGSIYFITRRVPVTVHSHDCVLSRVLVFRSPGTQTCQVPLIAFRIMCGKVSIRNVHSVLQYTFKNVYFSGRKTTQINLVEASFVPIHVYVHDFWAPSIIVECSYAHFIIAS